jgi:hypothetical protein
MESHHVDDETKGSVYFFVQDYIEAREASGSVRTAGPKDLTVTQIAFFLIFFLAMKFMKKAHVPTTKRLFP